MSKFSSAKAFKNMGKSCSFPITTKISQKELKKQAKTQITSNNNTSSSISDADFESIMKSDNLESKSNKKQIYNLPDPFEISVKVSNIINKGVVGEELCSYVRLSNMEFNGIELLNGLLNKYSDPSEISWIHPQKYGLALKDLFEDNLTNQMNCLLIIQRYCETHGFIKIHYKNNSVYLIKVLFQLLFTYGIVDEDAYWKWQEYIDGSDNLDDETKKTLLIQTTDFFMILKTVFDPDENNEENDDSDQDNKLNNYLKLNNKQDDGDENDNENGNGNENENENSDDVFKVPEEQDFNLDDL